MTSVDISVASRVATVTLVRGKVNALDEATLDALRAAFRDLASDDAVKAIILTGVGSFFSFGFDVPELFAYPKGAFRQFVGKFTSLYAELYLCPKPVVAALNGHAVAGGCMLAIACDLRIMASGRARIGLNEISFASTVPAGSVEILKGVVGQRRAEAILSDGTLYSAEEALALGLVDSVCAPADVRARAQTAATIRADRDGPAYRSLKLLARRAVADAIRQKEDESIAEFVDLWYSVPTREQLRRITIRPAS